MSVAYPGLHRERFMNLSVLLERAMSDPAMAATPHVAAVLDLLAQGLGALARLVVDDLEARADAVGRANP